MRPANSRLEQRAERSPRSASAKLRVAPRVGRAPYSFAWQSNTGAPFLSSTWTHLHAKVTEARISGVFRGITTFQTRAWWMRSYETCAQDKVSFAQYWKMKTKPHRLNSWDH